MPKQTVSVRGAIVAIGIGRTKLYELINSGELDVVRIGRRTLVTTASIERLLSEHRLAV